MLKTLCLNSLGWYGFENNESNETLGDETIWIVKGEKMLDAVKTRSIAHLKFSLPLRVAGLTWLWIMGSGLSNPNHMQS